MKTLIVNTPRSGGNALAIKLAASIPSLYVLNPFDGTGRNIIPPDAEKIIVKSDILYPDDNEFGSIFPVNIQLRLKFLSNVAKDYDEIVLLDRRDTIAQIESYAHALSKHTGLRVSDVLNTPYIYDSSAISKDTFETAKREVSDSKITIKKLSYKLKVPITYYEDIFNQHSNERYRKIGPLI